MAIYIFYAVAGFVSYDEDFGAEKSLEHIFKKSGTDLCARFSFNDNRNSESDLPNFEIHGISLHDSGKFFVLIDVE